MIRLQGNITATAMEMSAAAELPVGAADAYSRFAVSSPPLPPTDEPVESDEENDVRWRTTKPSIS